MAIQGNLDEIEAGLKPAVPARPHYQPYRKHPKYTGLLALYVHYLYVLGKIQKRQPPPRVTPRMKAAVMEFEQYREQFAFLREHSVTTAAELTDLRNRIEETLAALSKQRTILNVRKKQRRPLYDALTDSDALAPVRRLYEEGVPGFESEYTRYMEVVRLLEDKPVEALKEEKAALYDELAELNRQIRAERKNLKLCEAIQNSIPQMEKDLQNLDKKEMTRDEHRGR